LGGLIFGGRFALQNGSALFGKDFASENEGMCVRGGGIEFPYKCYLYAPKKYKHSERNTTKTMIFTIIPFHTMQTACLFLYLLFLPCCGK